MRLALWLILLLRLFASKNAVGTTLELSLPEVPAQRDNWSCGVHAAARLMGYHGEEIPCEELRAKVRGSVDVGLSAREYFVGWHLVGATPRMLASTMCALSQRKLRYLVKHHQTLEDIQRFLELRQPVIVLVTYLERWCLHYFVVHGISLQQKKVIYTNSNGGVYWKSFVEFLKIWHGDVFPGISTFGIQPATLIVQSGRQTPLEARLHRWDLWFPRLQIGPLFTPGVRECLNLIPGWQIVEGQMTEEPLEQVAAQVARRYVYGLRAFEAFVDGDLLGSLWSACFPVHLARSITGQEACVVQ
jgi:hypothetical protein